MNDKEKYRLVTYSDFVKEVVRKDKEKKAAKKQNKTLRVRLREFFR